MKKVFSFVLFTIIMTSFSFAQSTTPAPTSAPTMQGDLLWTREIYVYDSQDPDTLPLADVEVTATALETVTAVTDGEGRCEISVLAHDTGSVKITANKEGYNTFVEDYPGLPVNGTISIGLTAAPVLEPGAQAGDVWIYPQNLLTTPGSRINVEIHVNTGTQDFAAYGFTIFYDPGKLSIISVEDGAEGFISATCADYGILCMSGFNASGIAPGSNLHIVTLICDTYINECGETTIQMEIDSLTDSTTRTIGNPRAYNGTVNIICPVMGDVDSSGTIDIIDALKTAQHYVGLNVSINTVAADVNCDGEITIMDALLIAQYYVTIIDGFCK